MPAFKKDPPPVRANAPFFDDNFFDEEMFDLSGGLDFQKDAEPVLATLVN